MLRKYDVELINFMLCVNAYLMMLILYVLVTKN